MSIEKINPSYNAVKTPKMLEELQKIKDKLAELGLIGEFYFDIVPNILQKTQKEFNLPEGELNKHDIYHLLIGSSLDSQPLPLTGNDDYDKQFAEVDNFIHQQVMDYYKQTQQ